MITVNKLLGETFNGEFHLLGEVSEENPAYKIVLTIKKAQRNPTSPIIILDGSGKDSTGEFTYSGIVNEHNLRLTQKYFSKPEKDERVFDGGMVVYDGEIILGGTYQEKVNKNMGVWRMNNISGLVLPGWLTPRTYPLSPNSEEN